MYKTCGVTNDLQRHRVQS